MDALDPQHEPFALGDWCVDATGNRLWRGDEVRPLRHKAMALLVLLARRAGETVTRDEIVDAVWAGNRFVAQKAINTAVWTIRQALGDDPEAPRYVETIAKKGYRLIAPVRPLARADESTAAAPAAPAPRRPGWRGMAMLAAASLLAALAVVVLRPHVVIPPAAPTDVHPLTQNQGLEYLGRLSPDGRQLAFAWWQGQGSGKLYLRPAADLGAEPRLISGEGAADEGDVQGMAWSPDGSAIAYAATRGNRCSLWLYTLDPPRRRVLAPCAPMFTPTVDWSPDGRWIVFSGMAEGAGGLFLIAPDGSGLRRLSTAPPAAMADHQPAWSPDGQRIAFARQDPADGTRDLYEATLDGRLQRLTQLRLYGLHGLTYSSDGNSIVYSTTRQGARMLMRWDRAAAQAQPLGLEGSAPARSPDGGLVYALMRTHVSVAQLAAGSSAPMRLLSSIGSDRAPAVDTAGARVVFVSRRSGHPELWQASLDGSTARALTQMEGVVGAPAVAPRSGAIAFLGSCGPGHRFGLCLLPADGGTPRPLAADAANYGRPTWHPMAPEVWVASDRGGPWQLWRFPVDGSPGAAVDSDRPPRALQWAADGSGFVYQPRFSDALRWRPAGPGDEERPITTLPADQTLVDWRLAPAGLRLLTRGAKERFVHVDLPSGHADTLSEHALGTFPELASFDLRADGSALVELSDNGTADLMLAR